MSQAGDISAVSGPVPPNVPTQFTTDSGVAVPAANNLNVFGGVGSTTSGSGSTITINVTTTGFDWSEEASNFNAAVGHGYFCTAALTVTLPSSVGLAIGQTIIIYVDTASTVTIQANTGEFIQVGLNISTAAGTATSNTRGSILELVYRPSDLTWHSISSLGSWSVV
jgi:hypothetical protein